MKQNTNFNLFVNSINQLLFSTFSGSWRYKSIIILSLLSGFYLTNNVISYSLDKNYSSVLIVFLLVNSIPVLANNTENKVNFNKDACRR